MLDDKNSKFYIPITTKVFGVKPLRPLELHKASITPYIAIPSMWLVVELDVYGLLNRRFAITDLEHYLDLNDLVEE